MNNYFYTQLADRFGMTMQDIIDGVGGNPGYEGLMPAEHCGAAIVHSIARADQYHGQMVSPFLSIAKAKVIDLGKGLQTHLPDHSDEKPDGLDAVNTSMKEYLTSVLELNQNLEDRIVARTRELTLANEKLRAAINEVKQLSGLLPICSNCKGIRDDKGYWNQIEDYISTHTEAIFSHSICPKCAKNLYPDLDM